MLWGPSVPHILPLHSATRIVLYTFLFVCMSFNSNVSGILVVPKILNIYYQGEDIISKTSCIVNIWLGLISITGNVVTIMLIAIERTIAVFFPLKSIITTSKTKKVGSIIDIFVLELPSKPNQPALARLMVSRDGRMVIVFSFYAGASMVEMMGSVSVNHGLTEL